MSQPDESPRRRMYKLHRWVGLLLSVVAMMVFFSGTVVTFHEELDAWAGRGARYPAMQDVAGFDLDAALRMAATDVPDGYRDRISIRQDHHQPVLIYYQAVEGDEVSGYGTLLDPEKLSAIERRQGDREAVVVPSCQQALTRFFIDLHIFLLMPRTLGLVLTGLAGFALLLLIATGVLVHRPTRKKMLRAPRKRPRQFFGDLHTLLGSWSLPYTAILALTGTFFSFAGAVLIPVVTMAAFDGDQDKLRETFLGKVEVAASPAVASIDPILRDAVTRSGGGRVFQLFLLDWSEPNAHVTVRTRRSHIWGDELHTYRYDGHSGQFLHEKPALGTQPSFGNSLVRLMGKLHFGTLLGMTTKALWGVLGLATWLLAGSGLLVYLARRPHDRMHRAVSAATSMVLGGLPLATAIAALTWATTLALGGRHAATPMTVTLLAAVMAAGILGTRLDVGRAIAVSWLITGASLLLLLLAAPLAQGIGVYGAWADPALRPTVGVDVAIVFVAVTCIAAAVALLRRWSAAPVAVSGLESDDALDPSPAE